MHDMKKSEQLYEQFFGTPLLIAEQSAVLNSLTSIYDKREQYKAMYNVDAVNMIVELWNDALKYVFQALILINFDRQKNIWTITMEFVIDMVHRCISSFQNCFSSINHFLFVSVP